jgi:hypothetical protein
LNVGRCRGRRLPRGERCAKHERGVGLINAATRSIDPEMDAAADGDLRFVQDPVYAERVRHWLGHPKKLLDWRHTLARAQSLADMLEDKVRRMGPGGVIPPPLLAAIGELRLLHLALAKLEGRLDDSTHVHKSLVDALVVNVINVLTEFVPPERLPGALDRLRAYQAQAVPRRGANGRSTPSYG